MRCDGLFLFAVVICAIYNGNAIGPGAQTSRPDDAGPVRSLLGSMASPASSLLLPRAQGSNP
jgi:hypothetical protein